MNWKEAVLRLLSAVSFCLAVLFFGACFQSVDYHDGRYHPIPRTTYAITSLTLITAPCFWKLANRFIPPSNGAT